MRNDRARLPAWRRLMLLAIVAPALASAAQAAQAQGEPAKPVAASDPKAAASDPSSVEGVTVKATRPTAIGVPPEKEAAFKAQAAKDEAFRKYRQSTPPLTSDPNDQSKDFPGLQAYAPQ